MGHLIIGISAFMGFAVYARRSMSVVALIGVFLAFLWTGTLINLTMYSTVEYSGSTILFYLGRTVLFVGIVCWIVFSAYQCGSWILRRIMGSASELAPSVYAAAGLGIIMALLFVELALGVFNRWTVIPVLLLPLILNYRNIGQDLKMLIKPIEVSGLGKLGVACILLILLMNAITFGFTLSPFPVGFDALNYYVNLPKLMAQSGQLLPGFQPYNWSLMQAAGIAITGRIELALILSWMGLLLVQWATYEVGTRIMKLPADVSLVAVLLFKFMPSVMTQSSQELKVDLGLTYMLLAMVLTTFTLIQEATSDRTSRRHMLVLAALVGALGGVALGIKLTAVIALFAVVSILWYARLGALAFLGVFLVCLAIVFFAQLDSIAGLRVYHSSVLWLQYLALIGGLVLLVVASIGRIKLALRTATLSVVMAAASLVVFSPWVVKNYSEISKPSFMELLNGTSQGPQFNLRVIDRNLRKAKKNEGKK